MVVSSRPLRESGSDGALHRIARADRIAHRGKPTPQHAGQDRHRLQRDQHVGHVGLLREVQWRGHHVHMQVDQSGHQRAATDVNHLRPWTAQWPLRDLLDPAVHDQHVTGPRQLSRHRIEQRTASERHGLQCHGEGSRVVLVLRRASRQRSAGAPRRNAAELRRSPRCCAAPSRERRVHIADGAHRG
jgi:hypothetical protein